MRLDTFAWCRMELGKSNRSNFDMSKDLIVTEKPGTPTPWVMKGRRPKLANLRDIRTEMSRLYLATFYRGELPPEDYTKAVFGLRVLAEVVEAVEFEDRLKQLEEKTT